MIYLTAVSLGAGAWAAEGEHSGTVRLVDGDVFRGIFGRKHPNLTDKKENEGKLIWNCSSFSDPLMIPWSRIDSISISKTKSADLDRVIEDRNPQKYVVEFTNGECLTGFIKELQPNYLVLGSDRFPNQKFAMGSVRAILKGVNGDDAGDGKLIPADWKQLNPIFRDESDLRWTHKVGSIMTDVPGASIGQSVMLPPSSAIDLDVAWTHTNPNWTLTIGTKFPKLELRVRRLEMSDELSISLVLEEEAAADIATAILPFESLESIRLRILSDEKRGRYAVQHNGKIIGEVYAKQKVARDIKQQFQITNDVFGGLILRELKISREIFSLGDSSSETDDATASQTRQPVTLLLSNGDVLIGHLAEYDQEEQKVSFIDTEGRHSTHGWDEIDRVEFGKVRQPATTDGIWPKKLKPETELCIVQLFNGERLTGNNVAQTASELVLQNDTIQQSIRISLDQITSLQFVRTEQGSNPQSIETPETPMKLTSDDVDSNGWLVSSDSILLTEPQEGWYWHPRSLDIPVRLDPQMNGTIHIIRFKSNPTERESVSFMGSAQNKPFGRSLLDQEPAIYLRNGDSIPGKIESLKDGVLTFKTEMFHLPRIDSAKIRGVRHLVSSNSEQISEVLLKRLLTVPRMSRVVPPTHLVIARDGDFIRGNITSMDADVARIEVRGEERSINMKEVVEVIWLDPPPISESDKEKDLVIDGDAKANLSTCQIITRFGARVSVVPKSIKSDTLFGVHPDAGNCQFSIQDSIQILFGAEIEKSRASDRFAKWKLRYAIDPKFVKEANEEAETESQLVGAKAIDFDLEKAKGGRVQLSALKGRVVILDFWASWCGPCRRSLPTLQQLVNDFSHEQVELVAINLNEDPNVVRGAATVLGISSVCAIDPEGKIAKAYGVSSIPHTVVIDHEGIIRKVSVGANDETLKKLRDLLTKLHEPKAK